MSRTIIAVDPGLVTGLAVVWRGSVRPTLLYSGEWPPMRTGEEFQHLLSHRFPGADIVVERFTVTSATAKNSQAPWSLKVIGIVEWLVWRATKEDPAGTIVLQSPSDAKRLVPNALLKEYGLWHKGGAGHANDAIRHAVYRHAMLGWREPWEKSGVS